MTQMAGSNGIHVVHYRISENKMGMIIKVISNCSLL